MATLNQNLLLLCITGVLLYSLSLLKVYLRRSKVHIKRTNEEVRIQRLPAPGEQSYDKLEEYF